MSNDVRKCFSLGSENEKFTEHVLKLYNTGFDVT
jgi:hypothetical protein